MEQNTYSLLYRLAIRLFKLKVEDVRLVLAVKITRLLGALVFVFIGFVLSLFIITFVAVSMAHLLSDAMSPVWAYLIIAGVYMLLFLVIYLAKKPLIMDPIARFMSQLIVENPEK